MPLKRTFSFMPDHTEVAVPIELITDVEDYAEGFFSDDAAIGLPISPGVLPVFCKSKLDAVVLTYFVDAIAGMHDSEIGKRR